MNNYLPILAAIKYLYARGVDVTPYLDRLQRVVGHDARFTDVFNHIQDNLGVVPQVDIVHSYHHKVPTTQRDPREPAKLEKTNLERWIQDIFIRRFKAQLTALQNEHKALRVRKMPKPDNEDDLISELITAILSGVSQGITLFSQTLVIGFDLTQANTRAAEWARKYAYDLIKGIDATSLDVVRNAISSFVDTSGFTIGDVIDMVQPYFGDARASMIAVTETTRAFAAGQREAGEQLAREYPELTIYKTWFTNNDDRVCDECGPLDGKEIPMSEEFEGGLIEPPAHVNCRCWIDYNTKVGERDDYERVIVLGRNG